MADSTTYISSTGVLIKKSDGNYVDNKIGFLCYTTSNGIKKYESDKFKIIDECITGTSPETSLGIFYTKKEERLYGLMFDQDKIKNKLSTITYNVPANVIQGNKYSHYAYSGEVNLVKYGDKYLVGKYYKQYSWDSKPSIGIVCFYSIYYKNSKRYIVVGYRVSYSGNITNISAIKTKLFSFFNNAEYIIKPSNSQTDFGRSIYFNSGTMNNFTKGEDYILYDEYFCETNSGMAQGYPKRIVNGNNVNSDYSLSESFTGQEFSEISISFH